MGVRVWRYGHPEHVHRDPPLFPENLPTFGHRLAAQRYRDPAPFVAEVDGAWLVGRHATPVTRRGAVLMTPFRDQPKLVGDDSNDDLLPFIAARGWLREPEHGPAFDAVVPLVSRLDPNYFHWITEYCGQLEGVEHYIKATGVRAKILIRRGGPSFLRESLRLLGTVPGDIVEWPDDSPPTRVRRLVVGTLPGNRVGCSPRTLRWLRGRALANAGANADAAGATSRLYIPRRAGGWRCVRNDEQVARTLESRGFTTVRPETLSLREQVRLFARSSMIVGLHGAGLTNVLFAPRASVLELIGSYGGGEFYSLAAALGNPYAAMACNPVGHDVRVDMAVLNATIDRLERCTDAGPETNGRSA